MASGQALGTSGKTHATSKRHILYAVAYVWLPLSVQSLNQTFFPLLKILFLLQLAWKQSLLTE